MTPRHRLVAALALAAAPQLAAAQQPRGFVTRDSNGVWSVTLGPFAPDLYDYTFQIDDVTVPDPVNPSLTLGPRTASSLIEVPGDSAELWDARQVPHGTVHIN